MDSNLPFCQQLLHDKSPRLREVEIFHARGDFPPKGFESFADMRVAQRVKRLGVIAREIVVQDCTVLATAA